MDFKMNRRQLIKAGFLAALGVALAPVVKFFPKPSGLVLWCPHIPVMVVRVDLVGCYTPIVLRSDGEKWEPIGNILRFNGQGHAPDQSRGPPIGGNAMKWLRWMLPLAILFLFAMPLMGADSGPPGDVVIEQAVTGPTDPIPVLEAQDSILTPLLAGFRGSPLISADQSQHSTGAMAANYEPITVQGPLAPLLMRQTSDRERPWLWQPEGVVALCRCTSSGLQSHTLQA